MPRMAGSLAGSSVAMLSCPSRMLEPRDVAVRLGPRHRRHQVVDEYRVGAVRLRPLAGVVDQERVDQRQVAEHRVGSHSAESPAFLPGSHSRGCRACRGGSPNRRRSRRPPAGPPAVVMGGRGRGRSGSSPNPRGGCTSTSTLPLWIAASTRSFWSTNSEPGASPQCSVILSRRPDGSASNHRAYVAAGMRLVFALSCAWVSQSRRTRPPRPAHGSARHPRPDSTPGSPSMPCQPSSRSRRRSAMADAPVSRPTALPMRACLVG